MRDPFENMTATADAASRAWRDADSSQDEGPVSAASQRGVTLRAVGLGKAYKRYSRKYGRLAEWVGLKPRHELRWVLRDVSFEIGPGEAFGIVGANGAGKSTLLKLVAGTIRPTTGLVEVAGRVSAILELGLGFHPDFTGRENVVMAGALRGMPTQEVAERMEEIEAFAGIGDFIDQPVRTYSSGMQMRLAFSLATAVRPEVLIVDEALSVGDRFFSHKSMARIREFVEQGTALLFVSHDVSAIRALCRSALMLREGRVVELGDAGKVVDTYVGSVLQEESRRALRVMPPATLVAATSGGKKFPDGFESTHAQVDSGDVSIESFVMRAENGRPVQNVQSGDPVTFEYIVRAHRDLEDPHFGLSIRTRHGVSVFNTNSYAMGRRNAPLPAGGTTGVAFRVPMPLAADHYGVCIGVANRGYGDSFFEEYLNNTINIDVIEVVAVDTPIKFGGLVNLSPEYAVFPG
jgi:lipopolysaccharide transport system ATP-binding protein